MARRRQYQYQSGDGGDGVKDVRFWKSKTPHTVVFDHVQRIARNTSHARRDWFGYECLYDDSELASQAQRDMAIGEYTPQTLNCNVVKRHVDTYTAHRAKARPLPMAITDGGDYAQQRRAKSLSKFFEGTLDRVNFWSTRELRIRDSAIVGSGFALNWRDGDVIRHDRAFQSEFYVDPRDAERGDPRTMYMVRTMDRLVACERWGQFEKQIFEAADHLSEQPPTVGMDDTADLVLVVEAWHLPSRAGASDGAHAICVSNVCVEEGEYTRPYFPVSKRDYSPATRGYFGEGLAAQLAGIQYEVNAIGMRLQERHYMTGSYLMVEDQSGVEVDLVDNGTLTEVRYRGSKPEFVTPPAAHPDLFAYYMQLRGEIPAQESRMSQLSTRGELPAGLRSGRAQRVYKDIEDVGFVPDDRRDERDVIDTCWQFFDLAEEIQAESKETGTPYTVRVEQREYGRTRLLKLDYDKVRMDREDFVLKVFPVSFLSSTPADRFEQIREMIDAGMLQQDEGMALLDFPDVARATGLKTATRRFVEQVLTDMLEADDPYAPSVFIRPEPPMDLTLCAALGVMIYVDARVNRAEEKNLTAVLEWVEVARQMANPPPDPTAEAEAQAAAAQQPAVVDPATGMPMDPGMDPAMGMDPGMDPAMMGPAAGQAPMG